ncbi:archaeosine synthase subunit alpha [Candidatus Methanoliparum sp. LAM-1]|uniref:archaeosine synthase subunit alpha n=1 Tax=Candidatus Methanoliparum sp. LAM-1 TaxID=2874846 RepID=UPI001E4B77F5|nr:archaeosine synthase subunit alpha [Candidatus Methanoliparum sp. LAM-1]BDC36109.1 tRNA-ribosyltransferase [Candidatus Methanoliparum sp. LAM-1]
MRFEVLKEDGVARLGSLKLTDKKEIKTPGLVGEDLLNDLAIKIYDESSYPHINYLKNHSKSVNYLKNQDAEIYILLYANRYIGDYRKLSMMLTRTRDSIPPDSALFLRAIASPENVSIFVYYGVDLFDDIYGKVAALRGIYLTTEGEYRLKDLTEFPCNCPACKDKKPSDIDNENIKKVIEFLYMHNKSVLEVEIKKIRYLIERENITEYIEKQCRSSPWITALYRIMDHGFLSRRIPLFRRSHLYANTSDSFNRIEIKNFNDRVMERYQKPNLDNLLILPCSARKPYSLSPSHRTIIDAILPYRKYLHEVILTSPLGLVPRELELIYPASSYDIPVTGKWTYEEIEWGKHCLKKFLDKNKYKNIIAHVDGAYRDICELVEEELGLNVVYTSGSIENLKKAMLNIDTDKKITNKERKFLIFRSMLSYQFGCKMANEILNGQDDIKIRGKYPYMTAFIGKKQFLKVNMIYKLVDLTIDAVENVKKIRKDIFPGDYAVSIEDFVPLGDVFNIGVIDTDKKIRPNDLVLFEGKRAIGFGMAKISGWEMVKSRKGSAIKVKSVKEVN